MRHRNSPERPILGRNLPGAWALALAVALALSLAQSAWAQVSPPDVPTNIEVPEGAEPFLVGHAVGTQNYVCLPAGSKVAWSLFTPQATLFDDEGQQLTTHFFSPNPFENGTVRPAWQHSQDTSTVWVRLRASSTDPEFVAPGAIPWLLLEVAGDETGPDDGDALTEAAYIQRVNTTGGIAPSTGCSKSKDLGQKAFVPYTADYFFYLDPEIE